MRKKEISMIILAGGASSRMGRDKSDLTIDGKTFLEMQIEKGEKLGISDILLSGYHGENKYKYPIIPEVYCQTRFFPCRKMLQFQNVRRKVSFLFTYLTHQSVTFL